MMKFKRFDSIYELIFVVFCFSIITVGCLTIPLLVYQLISFLGIQSKIFIISFVILQLIPLVMFLIMFTDVFIKGD